MTATSELSANRTVVVRMRCTTDHRCTAEWLVDFDAYKWSAAGARSGRFPRHAKLPNGEIGSAVTGLDAWLADHEAS